MMYSKPITQRAKCNYSSANPLREEVTIDGAGKIPGDFSHSPLKKKGGCGCGCGG
jgi:hypothetical protein